jgi:hypothetical protein
MEQQRPKLAISFSKQFVVTEGTRFQVSGELDVKK